jgi:hypothetical protein
MFSGIPIPPANQLLQGITPNQKTETGTAESDLLRIGIRSNFLDGELNHPVVHLHHRLRQP